MNKHLETLHVGEVIAITETTNLFETLYMGRLEVKFIVWLPFEWKPLSLFSFYGLNII